MQNLIDNAPNVAQAFFGLTKACREQSVLGNRINELILVGIFTAQGSPRGLRTHIGRALEHGATQEELLAAITLALPVVGITHVNQAMDVLMECVASHQEAPRHS